MDLARKERISGIIFITMTLIGWSSVLLFLKYLTPYIDPWTANGWRYGLSALLWLPLLVVGLRRGTLPDGLWRRAVVPACINCIAQVCFAAAPYYIGAGLTAFLLRVNIIFSTVGAFVLFSDERPLARSGRFWTGMALLLGGSVGTVLLGAAPITGATATGVLLGLAAGAVYGMYGVSVRYYMRNIPSMTSFAVISLYTASGLVVLMAFFGSRGGMSALDLSSFNWFMLAASALIGIALGHVFYYSAIARLGVAVSAAIVLLAPFICGAASVVLFNEVLTRAQWLCGVVMICGAGFLLVAERARHRKPEPSTIPGATVEIDATTEPAPMMAERA